MGDKEKVAGTDNWRKYGSGFPGDLSHEQQEILTEFLNRCPKDQIEAMRFPAEPPDYFGCRVLRARKFVCEDALKLVTNTVQWRKEKKINELVTQDPYHILQCTEDEILYFYPKCYFPSTDREGRPIYAEKGGIVDIEAMYAVLENDIDRMINYHIYGNEQHMVKEFTRCSKLMNKPITTITTIMDMEGMSFNLIRESSRNYVAAMIGIDKEHYPETLAKMYFINVPSFFSVGFAMIKPFLDERTVKKIEIYSSPSEWMPRLIEHIGENNLPEEYGGKLKIPNGLYPKSRTNLTHISSGKLFTEVVDVTKGQYVRFKWLCRPGDMRMSVTFYPRTSYSNREDYVVSIKDKHKSVPSNDKGITVYKLQDHPGSDKNFVTIKPTDPAPEDGIYVALYDNTKGWRSREVFHRYDYLIDGIPVSALQSTHMEQTLNNTSSSSTTDSSTTNASSFSSSSSSNITN